MNLPAHHLAIQTVLMAALDYTIEQVVFAHDGGPKPLTEFALIDVGEPQATGTEMDTSRKQPRSKNARFASSSTPSKKRAPRPTVPSRVSMAYIKELPVWDVGDEDKPIEWMIRLPVAQIHHAGR